MTSRRVRVSSAPMLVTGRAAFPPDTAPTIGAPSRLAVAYAVAGALALLALTLGAYAPALSAGWIWDDDNHVTRNVVLRSLTGLNWIWTRPGASTGQYYPLTHTTFWIEYQLWRDWAPGYHLVNVLIHGMSSVLVWRILRRLGLGAAWLAAAVFAVHPVHAESVVWVSERKNVLSGVFYLASMLALLHSGLIPRAEDDPPKPRVRLGYYLLGLLLFAAALLSKTVTGSLPAALLLIAWWKSGRLPWRQALWLTPMFLGAIVMGRNTAHMERWAVGAVGPEWDFSFADRLLIAGRAVWFYAGKLLWPANLSFIYPRWKIDPQQAWQWAFPLAAALLVLALWAGRRRIGRGPLVAVLFFGGTVFPALGFVNIYPMLFSFVADHFQYLASLGLIALASELLWRHVPVGRGLVVLPLVLATLTWVEAHRFHDEETLWEATLRTNPDAAIAHDHLGSLRQDQPEVALGHFREALRLEPDHPEAYVGIAEILLSRGDYAGGIWYYRQAVDRRPEKIMPRQGLARALYRSGDVAGAERELRELLNRHPRWDPARATLARILLQAERGEEGMALLQEGAQAYPESPQTRELLADLLLERGRGAEAAGHLEWLLRLRPQDESLRRRLAAARGE